MDHLDIWYAKKCERQKKIECHICLVSLGKAALCPDLLRDATGLPLVLGILDIFYPGYHGKKHCPGKWLLSLSLSFHSACLFNYSIKYKFIHYCVGVSLFLLYHYYYYFFHEKLIFSINASSFTSDTLPIYLPLIQSNLRRLAVDTEKTVKIWSLKQCIIGSLIGSCILFNSLFPLWPNVCRGFKKRIGKILSRKIWDSVTGTGDKQCFWTNQMLCR